MPTGDFKSQSWPFPEHTKIASWFDYSLRCPLSVFGKSCNFRVPFCDFRPQSCMALEHKDGIIVWFDCSFHFWSSFGFRKTWVATFSSASGFFKAQWWLLNVSLTTHFVVLFSCEFRKDWVATFLYFWLLQSSLMASERKNSIIVWLLISLSSCEFWKDCVATFLRFWRLQTSITASERKNAIIVWVLISLSSCEFRKDWVATFLYFSVATSNVNNVY